VERQTYETHHRTCEPTGHHCKANEQEEARPPHCSGVSKALVTLDAVFVDQVDDEEAEQREYAGNPVDEGDVDRDRPVGFPARRMRMCG
jgi:hypothetical protein